MRYLNTVLVIISFTALVLVLMMAYGFPSFPYYMPSSSGISGNWNAYAESDNQGYANVLRSLTGSLPDTLPAIEMVPVDPSMGAYPFGLSLGWMGISPGGFGMPGYGFPWGSFFPGYGMFGMYGSGYGTGYGSGMPYGTDAVTVTTQTFHKFCFPGGFCFYAIVDSEQEAD
ncbi:MAG: hypothetical protein ACMUIS_10765 [bacterium]